METYEQGFVVTTKEEAREALNFFLEVERDKEREALWKVYHDLRELKEEAEAHAKHYLKVAAGYAGKMENVAKKL